MEDSGIIELFWVRSEQALRETKNKYGGLCWNIAYRILENREDAEETVSDVYLDAWNSIPPQRPNSLPAYLSRLTRRRAIDKWRSRNAKKRGGGVTVALEELKDCVPAPGGPEQALYAAELSRAIEAFLGTLPADQRRMFILRYWYFQSIGDLSWKFGYSSGHVKTTLYRIRKKLRLYLTEKGAWDET